VGETAANSLDSHPMMCSLGQSPLGFCVFPRAVLTRPIAARIIYIFTAKAHNSNFGQPRQPVTKVETLTMMQPKMLLRAASRTSTSLRALSTEMSGATDKALADHYEVLNADASGEYRANKYNRLLGTAHPDLPDINMTNSADTSIDDLLEVDLRLFIPVSSLALIIHSLFLSKWIHTGW
jgi:hypothetical protein